MESEMSTFFTLLNLFDQLKIFVDETIFNFFILTREYV